MRRVFIVTKEFICHGAPAPAHQGRRLGRRWRAGGALSRGQSFTNRVRLTALDLTRERHNVHRARKVPCRRTSTQRPRLLDPSRSNFRCPGLYPRRGGTGVQTPSSQMIT